MLGEIILSGVVFHSEDTAQVSPEVPFSDMFFYVWIIGGSFLRMPPLRHICIFTITDTVLV